MRANTHMHAHRKKCVHRNPWLLHSLASNTMDYAGRERTSFPQKSARICVHNALYRILQYFFLSFTSFHFFCSVCYGRFFFVILYIYSLVCHKFCVFRFFSTLDTPHTYSCREMRIVGTRRIYSSVAVVFYFFFYFCVFFCS